MPLKRMIIRNIGNRFFLNIQMLFVIIRILPKENNFQSLKCNEDFFILKNFSSIGQSLTHYVKKLPSKRYSRKVLTLDLHKIQDDHPEWSHIVLTLLPTKEPVQINIDIHSAAERQLTYQMPSWYSYRNHLLTESTMMGAGTYRINFASVEESYQSVELHVSAKCLKSKYHVVAKVCVPWTRGFERYHYFT